MYSATREAMTRVATGPDLELLVDLVHEAGRLAMAHYNNGPAVHQKSDGSPVTAADRAAHDCIVRELPTLCPGAPIISEEAAVPEYETRKNWDRFWLVDPLDGTKEFLSMNGEFTVNIALIEGGHPVMGVVGAPALGAVYFAARGRGAWRRVENRSSERLQVTAHRRAVTRVVESRSHPSPELEGFVATLGPVERVKLGSSLKFCRIAEGGADVYPRFGRTMEWDVAAGDCIYRNSGPDGKELGSPLRYNQPSLSTPSFIIGKSALS